MARNAAANERREPATWSASQYSEGVEWNRLNFGGVVPIERLSWGSKESAPLRRRYRRQQKGKTGPRQGQAAEDLAGPSQRY